MSHPDSTEQLQLLVIEYLYGELGEEERERFEKTLESNGELQRILESEQRLNSALPAGAQPLIDEERVQGNRWLLRQNLQKESRPRFSLSQWWRETRERPLNLALQGAAMAMTFVLGILVASPGSTPVAVPGAEQLAVNAVSPLQLVNDEDFEIYQLKVNSYDSATGEIDLSFALASETRLSGNVADQTISQLMAVALQDDIDSASRLDTINALQPVVSADRVYEALIHVLTNDQNPGVRYQAVQSLVALSDQERVREALRVALQQDVNQGVRVEAFNALTNYQDEQTLAVFRQQMETDSNEYIRTQARTIVEAVDGADVVL